MAPFLVSNFTNASDSVSQFLGANEPYAYNGYEILCSGTMEDSGQTTDETGVCYVTMSLPKAGKCLILTLLLGILIRHGPYTYAGQRGTCPGTDFILATRQLLSRLCSLENPRTRTLV